MLVSSHVLAEVSQTADDVVVIASGRSVAQAPLQELMARSGGGDARRRPGRRRLARAAHAAEGADGRAATATEIVVHERSGEDIGRVVAEHQLVISELTPVGASLEEVFFELTDAREARHDPADRRRAVQAAHHADVLRARRRRARPHRC